MMFSLQLNKLGKICVKCYIKTSRQRAHCALYVQKICTTKWCSGRLKSDVSENTRKAKCCSDLIRQFSKIFSAYFWRASIDDFLDLLHHSFCSVGSQHLIHLISCKPSTCHWYPCVVDQLENRSKRDPSNKRDPRHSSRKNRSERFPPRHPNRAATFP